MDWREQDDSQSRLDTRGGYQVMIDYVKDQVGEGQEYLNNLVRVVLSERGCYYQFREKEHTYGNVFRQPLDKVWFGRRHADALRRIKVSECNKWDCKYFVYNKLMKEALVEDQAQWQFV